MILFAPIKIRDESMSRQLALTLVISVALHLLLSWYIANRIQHFLQPPTRHEHASLIQISIAPQNTTSKSHLNPTPNSIQNNNSSPISKPKTNQQSSQPTTAKAGANKRHNRKTESAKQEISSAKILSSSKEVSRMMANTENKVGVVKKSNSVSTIYKKH
jgi:hypothetical protein